MSCLGANAGGVVGSGVMLGLVLGTAVTAPVAYPGFAAWYVHAAVRAGQHVLRCSELRWFVGGSSACDAFAAPQQVRNAQHKQQHEELHSVRPNTTSRANREPT